VNKPQENSIGDEPIRTADASDRKKKKMRFRMRVSRYYSPVKHQKRYYTGSLAGDLERNGRGKKTSSGLKPSVFVIAADRKIWPPGSLVWSRWRYYIVGDSGGGIRGHRVDFYTGVGDKGLRKAIHPKVKSTHLVFRVLRLGPT
jgi:3D (Asp-Asp-Asp) domain-containing protein